MHLNKKINQALHRVSVAVFIEKELVQGHWKLMINFFLSRESRGGTGFGFIERANLIISVNSDYKFLFCLWPVNRYCLSDTNEGYK